LGGSSKTPVPAIREKRIGEEGEERGVSPCAEGGGGKGVKETVVKKGNLRDEWPLEAQAKPPLGSAKSPPWQVAGEGKEGP